MTPPDANDRPDPEPTQAGPPSTRLEPIPAESFAHWRSRVLHRLLLVIAVLGSVAYVPSIWAAIGVGAWSGLELLRNRSRDQTASWDPEVEEVLEVVLFSGVVDDEVRRRARKARCRHVGSKPFELQELAAVVRKALGEAATNAAP